MIIKPFKDSTTEEKLELLALFDSLPERVRSYAWSDTKDHYEAIGYGLLQFVWNVAASLTYIEKCESPIEQLLALAMEYRLPSQSLCHYTLTPQYKLGTAAGNYRADFYIEFCNYNKDFMPLGDVKKLVVECDGHDFHERTKAQSAKDKKRDRAMQAAGYYILRFTGSEIYRDPNSCVDEIRDFMHATLGI